MLGKTKNKHRYFLFAIIFVMVFCARHNYLKAATFEEAANAEIVNPAVRDLRSITAPYQEDKSKTVDTRNIVTQEAKDLAKNSDSIFLKPVKWILYMFLVVASWLVSLGATILEWVLTPGLWGQGGFLENEIVYETWGTFRDLFNMFFILMLLFSAFSTIFQVEKYNIKKIFLSTLLAVLLINFSFPIARIIIDISNVMMFSFLNGGSGMGIATKFMSASQLGGILVPGSYSDYSVPYLIAAIIFVFIMGITLITLAMMLMIRLLALLVIIIVSPIGFVGSVFPGTSGLSGKWWDALFRYAFFGPAMVFVMGISTSIMVSLEKGGSTMSTLKAAASKSSPAVNGMGQDFATWLGNAALFFLPVALLWIGMGISRSMGIAGAGAVVGAAEKTAKWIGKHSTATPIGAGLRKLDRDVLKTWSPRAILKGWDDRSKSQEDDHLAKATGAWRDRINSTMSLGKDKTYFKDAAFQSVVLKKEKELADVNQESEFLMRQYENAKSKNDTKTMAATLRLMFKNNDQNEFMKLQGEDVDPSRMRDLIFEQLKSAGMSDNDAAKQLSDLSEIAVSKGNYANYGMAYMDETGHFKVNTDTREIIDSNGIAHDVSQAALAIGKQSNIKAQAKADSWHWNSFLVETKDGGTGRIHEAGKRQLQKITQQEIDVLKRARTDFIDRMNEAIPLIQDLINKSTKPEEKRNMEAFVRELQLRKEGKADDKKPTSSTKVKPTPTAPLPTVGPLEMENSDLNQNS